jgi:hypothetical protein
MKAKRHNKLGRLNLGRWVGLGSAGAVMAVAAIMALTPVASASAANVVLTHPYKGFSESVSSSYSQGGCGRGKINLAPQVSLTKGTFRTDLSSSTPACKGVKRLSNQASAYASMSLETTGLNFAAALKAHGTPRLNVTYSMKVNESWGMTEFSGCTLNYSAPYSTCQAYAEVSIFAYIFLDDESNSTWGPYGYGYAESNFVDIYTMSFADYQNWSQNYCYLGNCTHYGGNYTIGTPGAGTFSGVINASNVINLTGSTAIGVHDVYDVEMYFEISVDSGAYTEAATATGSAAAYANVDAGTHGNGIVLDRIALT